MQIPIRPAPVSQRGGRGGRDADGLTAEQRQENDARTAVWAFVWILFGFKLVTGVIIFLAASRSREAGEVLGATHWFWLFIPIVAVAGPLAYQLRLRRVRRRVRALQRSEWLVPEGPTRPRDVEALRRAEWMVD